MTRESIAKAIQEGVTYSGQLDTTVIHGAIDAILKQHETEVENLKSVMIAAAEEIQAHWQTHCDSGKRLVMSMNDKNDSHERI